MVESELPNAKLPLKMKVALLRATEELNSKSPDGKPAKLNRYLE